jgi:hypothetical protein
MAHNVRNQAWLFKGSFLGISTTKLARKLLLLSVCGGKVLCKYLIESGSKTLSVTFPLTLVQPRQ